VSEQLTHATGVDASLSVCSRIVVLPHPAPAISRTPPESSASPSRLASRGREIRLPPCTGPPRSPVAVGVQGSAADDIPVVGAHKGEWTDGSRGRAGRQRRPAGARPRRRNDSGGVAAHRPVSRGSPGRRQPGPARLRRLAAGRARVPARRGRGCRSERGHRLRRGAPGPARGLARRGRRSGARRAATGPGSQPHPARPGRLRAPARCDRRAGGAGSRGVHVRAAGARSAPGRQPAGAAGAPVGGRPRRRSAHARERPRDD
jgi:hypothetical protein